LQFLSLKENKHLHILKDEIMELRNELSKAEYANTLRSDSVWDKEQVIELITNQFNGLPNTIGELYK
jgi:hypothetical protein